MLYGPMPPPRRIPPPGKPPADKPSETAPAKRSFLDFLDTGLRYLQQRDAEKRAEEQRRKGIDAHVVAQPDGSWSVVEAEPFYKNKMVLLAGGGVLLVLALIALRPRSNPPRRRGRRNPPRRRRPSRRTRSR